MTGTSANKRLPFWAVSRTSAGWALALAVALAAGQIATAQAQDPATYNTPVTTTHPPAVDEPPKLASASHAQASGPTLAQEPALPATSSHTAPLASQNLAGLGLTPLRSDLSGMPVSAGQPAFSLERLPLAVRRADALQRLIEAHELASQDQAYGQEQDQPQGQPQGQHQVSAQPALPQQLASLSPPPSPSLTPPPVTQQPEPGPLVLTLVGDVGLAENRRLKTARSSSYWAPFTKGLAPLIDGDFNFLNLETVVTDRPLKARSKTFAFQTHDTALAHLAQDLGFNLFSLANNHSGDFRRAGQVATLTAISQHAPGAIFHGLGTEEELLKVREFEHNGIKIAFAAIGISSGAPRPSDDQPGQFFIRRAQDWDAVIQAFKVSNADLKILSVHEGREKVSEAESSLKRKLRQARDEGGVDLVVGHHPHVVRAIEHDPQGRLIAYSLGNGLLFGAANIDNRPLGRDFGLFLRLHYWFDGRHLSLEAIEGVALRGMHSKVRPRSARQAAQRFRFLNRLSRKTAGKLGLQFDITREGHGLWCADAPKAPRAQTLCQGPRSTAKAEQDKEPQASSKPQTRSRSTAKTKKRSGTVFKTKR